jgi:hypothetical protein
MKKKNRTNKMVKTHLLIDAKTSSLNNIFTPFINVKLLQEILEGVIQLD